MMEAQDKEGAGYELFTDCIYKFFEHSNFNPIPLLDVRHSAWPDSKQGDKARHNKHSVHFISDGAAFYRCSGLLPDRYLASAL